MMKSCIRGRFLLIGGAAACFAAPAFAQQFVEQTAARFPSPNPSEWSNQATIGDIDGDGDLDIIFANGGNFSSPGTPLRQRLYVNDGAGVFTEESAARLGAVTLLARGVEMGDIDNDGDLDLIFAQDFSRQPQLFVNDGTGFFANQTAVRLPAMLLSSSRAQFGDIDNDGDLDIYITSGTTSRFTCGQYRVWVNDGTGIYVDETDIRHPIGNVCNNMDCIFGDIDNDYDLDVRTASTGTNNSRMYRNNGHGIFGLVAGVPADSTCYSYDFGDINGDGAIDLLGVNAGGGSTELLLENSGFGSFTNVSSQISPNPNQDDNDSKFLDIDDDGDLDMLIGRLGSGGEKIYANDGSGNFTQLSGIITIISDSTLDIMVADLDNDGDYDIVSAQGESGNFQNRVYINNGPADTHAPRIIQTEQLADTEDTVGPYVVRANILDDMTSDRNFFDKGITLHYTVDAGREMTVPMRHSGGQVYRGVLPGLADGGTVEYWVSAVDWNDNEAIGDPQSFTVSGASILGDLDGDGDVDPADLAALLAAWGTCPGCPEDLDGDGTVGPSDLAILLANWS
ncbi:MAG: VCBS repeat-containing protein [Phycisphaerales bacterium]|nr:VCBS repeat-containing protein [Phycisphaerales bacterium]